MKHKLGELIQMIAKVGALPGAEPYQDQLREVIALLANSAITASLLKKEIKRQTAIGELLGAKPEKAGEAHL